MQYQQKLGATPPNMDTTPRKWMERHQKWTQHHQKWMHTCEIEAGAPLALPSRCLVLAAYAMSYQTPINSIRCVSTGHGVAAYATPVLETV
eukprot:1193109-Rhodomonas_salina.2